MIRDDREDSAQATIERLKRRLARADPAGELGERHHPDSILTRTCHAGLSASRF